jgi:hypothetical protein
MNNMNNQRKMLGLHTELDTSLAAMGGLRGAGGGLRCGEERWEEEEEEEEKGGGNWGA